MTKVIPRPAGRCGSSARIRRITLTVAECIIERDTRHGALQDRVVAAFGVEAASWAPAPTG